MFLTIGALKRLSGYLAGQLKSAVSITGGAIDGTTVGATTASTGKFTTLTTTRGGTFTCNGATPVTVSNTNITANSCVIITLKTVGGTVGAVPAIQTITASTGFTVAGTAGDTSVYNYAIVNNNG